MPVEEDEDSDGEGERSQREQEGKAAYPIPLQPGNEGDERCSQHREKDDGGKVIKAHLFLLLSFQSYYPKMNRQIIIAKTPMAMNSP